MTIGLRERLRRVRRRIFSPFQKYERKWKQAAERFVIKTVSKHQNSITSSTPNGTIGPNTPNDYLSSHVLLAFLKSSQREPLIREPCFQAMPLSNGMILATHPVADYLFVDSTDLKSLPGYALGKYQERATFAIERHFFPGEHVLHIGAQFGFHTLTLAHTVGERGSVIALEASEKFRHLLDTNLSAHGLEGRVGIAAPEDVPGSLMNLLTRQATGIESIYITEGADIPAAWRSDLAKYLEQGSVKKTLIGSKVFSHDSQEAPQVAWSGLANNLNRDAA